MPYILISLIILEGDLRTIPEVDDIVTKMKKISRFKSNLQI